MDGRPGPPLPAGTASEAHARTRGVKARVRLTVVPAEWDGQQLVDFAYPGAVPDALITVAPGRDGSSRDITGMVEEPGRYRIVVPEIDGVYGGLEVMTEFWVR